MPEDHVPTRDVAYFDGEGNQVSRPGARWLLTLQNPDDPHGHSARARQLTATRWDVDYYRGEDLVSTGGISTPPPHEPPFATLTNTLDELRAEADRHGHDYLRPLSAERNPRSQP